MARVFFMAFNDADQVPLIKALRAAGHKLVVAQPKAPEFTDLLRQQLQPPEIVVADMSKRPSQALEAIAYVRGLRAQQTTPFLLYNVKPEDQGRAGQRIAGARLLADGEVLPVLQEILAARAAKA